MGAEINGDYIKTRKLWIGQEFNEALFKDVVPKLAELVQGKDPITIYICSNGGECDIGMAITDLIEIAKGEVRTVNIGRAFSMGFMVLIAGKKRYSLPNNPMMMHEFGAFKPGQYTKQKKFQMHLDDLQAYFIRHITKHTRLKKAEVEKLLLEEEWVYPKQALEYGFIDEIITEVI